MKNYTSFNFAVLGIFSGLSISFLFLLPVVIFSYWYFVKKNLSANLIRLSLVRGWLFGIGFFLGSMHWIVSPFLIYERHFVLAPLSLLFPILLGLFFIIPAYILQISHKYLRVFKQNFIFLQSFIIASSFFLAEIIRSYIFGGLPFNLTAHIWAFREELIQISKYIGVYGLSFLTLIWISFLISLINRNYWKTLLFTFLFFPTFLFSFNYFDQNKGDNYNELTFRIIQPNINQKDKWDKLLFEKNLNRLLNLTTQDNFYSEEIIVVWPEVALTFFLNEESDLISYLTKKIPKNMKIITGGLRRVFSKNDYEIYNTLYLLNNETLSFYDKKKLVPFGEFVPLRGILNLFKLTPGSTDFSEGKKENQIKVVLNNLVIYFEPSICYEAIFQTSGAELSSIMINITNDAWFGKTTGPRQHLAAQIFRSVEKSVFFLRSANSGISVAVDNKGRILKKMELGSEGYFDIKIQSVVTTTAFEKYGNFLIFILFVVLLIFFCLIEFLFSIKRKH